MTLNLASLFLFGSLVWKDFFPKKKFGKWALNETLTPKEISPILMFITLK